MTSTNFDSKSYRVLLVNPPRDCQLIGQNPALIERHRGFNPPLGLLQLATYVEAHSNHRVEIMDCQPPGWSYPEFENVLRQKLSGIDVVGITTMTFTLIDVIKTVQVVKRVKPECVVILGGSHIHLYPNETISIEGVDVLIQGEGEMCFVDLLNNLSSKEKMELIPGLVFIGSGGRVVNTGIAPPCPNMDDLGWPERGRIDLSSYASIVGKEDQVTTIMSSRGCPFQCTFCERPKDPVLGKFRWRSAIHVVKEIEECISLGIREAIFYDDTFTVRKERVFEFCEEILKRRIKFRWSVRAHVNTVSLPLLRAMSNAGCERIHYGVESGNNRMLKLIRKNTTVDKVEQVFKWTREAGMDTLAYFIVGQQTETAKDIQDTITLAKRLKPDYVHFAIFCPYPGTEIYQQGLERGIVKSDVWREFARNPKNDFEIPFWEENFSGDELREIIVKCYKSFYVRPGYLLQRLSKIRRFGEFKRKLKAGWGVMTMTPRQKLNSD